MPRLLCRIGACSLAGVLLTVVVSWTLAVVYHRDRPMTIEDMIGWPMPKSELIAESLAAASIRGTPEKELVFIWCASAREFVAIHRATGWPLLALGTRVVEYDHKSASEIHQHRKLRSDTLKTTLPATILFPGFLLNTLFYATLLFTLFTTPKLIRRHLRRRRNHCPTCNYNLRGLAPTSPCPECGCVSPQRGGA
jgi:hypothetical protein